MQSTCHQDVTLSAAWNLPLQWEPRPALVTGSSRCRASAHPALPPWRTVHGPLCRAPGWQTKPGLLPLVTGAITGLGNTLCQHGTQHPQACVMPAGPHTDPTLPSWSHSSLLAPSGPQTRGQPPTASWVRAKEYRESGQPRQVMWRAGHSCAQLALAHPTLPSPGSGCSASCI